MKKTIENIRALLRFILPARLALASVLAVGLALVAGPGCQSDAQTGGFAGAGIGALAGQAIGGNTEATLIGTAVGAGLGYIIGNEQDKQKARQMSSQPARPAALPSPPSPPPSPAHDQVGRLGGTRWNLVSLSPGDYADPYLTKVVNFRPDGYVTTSTTTPEGRLIEETESYRVLGDTLIVNRPGYLINARYSISGSQLIIRAEDFSAVLERLAY